MEIAHKRSQSIHSKCANACQDKYENKQESLESNKATKSVDPTQEECVIQYSRKDVETSGEFSPSIDKFCRAARVLGVCLLAKEMYSDVFKWFIHVCKCKKKFAIIMNPSSYLEQEILYSDAESRSSCESQQVQMTFLIRNDWRAKYEKCFQIKESNLFKH